MTFYTSATTDVGIKKPINQDSVMVRSISCSAGDIVFACVCDGMGGLQSGELASATVLKAFEEWLDTKLPLITAHGITEGAVIDGWAEIVSRCNDKILAYGNGAGITLGTTLTAILLTQTDYYIVNIGDSRTYEITDTLKQLTHDHTFVQQEVDAGHMTAQEALTSNKRHILTRCIGAREDMAPDFFSGKVKKDAVYMLCSDGFRHTVSEQEFIQHLSPVTINCDEDLKKREVYLIDVNKQRRENDNISVVTVAAR